MKHLCLTYIQEETNDVRSLLKEYLTQNKTLYIDKQEFATREKQQIPLDSQLVPQNNQPNHKTNNLSINSTKKAQKNVALQGGPLISQHFETNNNAQQQDSLNNNALQKEPSISQNFQTNNITQQQYSLNNNVLQERPLVSQNFDTNNNAQQQVSFNNIVLQREPLISQNFQTNNITQQQYSLNNNVLQEEHLISQNHQTNNITQQQNSISVIQNMLKLFEKLTVDEAIKNQNIRFLYNGFMFNKKIERKTGNSAYLISQMFFETYMPFLDLMMRANPRDSDQLATLFVEEHLDFFVTAKVGLVRKQVQNDKLICAFVLLVKLLKAQRGEGRKIYTTLVVILTKKLGVLFDKNQNPNPLDLIKHQKYLGEIFNTNQQMQQEPLIPEDSNLMYLSILRKLSMLLWGLLWLDPNIFFTDQMQQNLQKTRQTIQKYSKVDLEKDRAMFFEYLSAFVLCSKENPKFQLVPALSSLWDILSYSIYKSQKHQISHQDNEEMIRLLRSIFQKCEPVISISHNESMDLGGRIINNTTACLKQLRFSYPNLSNNQLKNIHDELFVNSYQNQKGQIDILKTKQKIINGIINERNEDYNDYDFYKVLFEADQRQEYYT